MWVSKWKLIDFDNLFEEGKKCKFAALKMFTLPKMHIKMCGKYHGRYLYLQTFVEITVFNYSRADLFSSDGSTSNSNLAWEYQTGTFVVLASPLVIQIWQDLSAFSCTSTTSLWSVGYRKWNKGRLCANDIKITSLSSLHWQQLSSRLSSIQLKLS